MSTTLETIGIILLAILPIFLTVWNKQHNEPQIQQSLDDRREDYGQKMTSQYGEPKQSLWTADMPVLIYDSFMVMEGVQVPLDNIEDVTWNNADNYPWGGGTYQVIVQTNLPGHEFLYALMGNDPQEAIALAEHIRSYMQK